MGDPYGRTVAEIASDHGAPSNGWVRGPSGYAVRDTLMNLRPPPNLNAENEMTPIAAALLLLLTE